MPSKESDNLFGCVGYVEKMDSEKRFKYPTGGGIINRFSNLIWKCFSKLRMTEHPASKNGEHPTTFRRVFSVK